MKIFPKIKNISTIPNRYENFYTGNRRTSLEFAMELTKNGVFAQFGVYKGESAKWLLTDKCQELYLYDSFEGLPENWNRRFKKGHFKCEMPFFDDPRVKIVKGFFEETVDRFNKIQFGIINIDCDLYSSTMTVLNNIEIFNGQILVFDEMYRIQSSQENEMKAFLDWSKYKNIDYNVLGKTGYSQVIIELIC